MYATMNDYYNRTKEKDQTAHHMRVAAKAISHRYSFRVKGCSMLLPSFRSIFFFFQNKKKKRKGKGLVRINNNK